MVSSVSEEHFHRFVVNGCGQTDACLAALAYLSAPSTISSVRDALTSSGLHGASNWNISRALRTAKTKAVFANGHWALTPSGKDWANGSGLYVDSVPTENAQRALRGLLTRISEPDTREFVEEAIACLEHNLRRSAVVMSWLAAVHVLKAYAFSCRRSEFDAEAKRVDPKWRPVRSLDDYGRMKESEFLDRLSAISVIGKNVKGELVECLNRRNSCGHPNSYKLGDATVAHHIETLILNVFSKFV